MTKPYKAIIKGKCCNVKWDDNQENVLLVNDVPHEVGVMHINPAVLRSQTLVQIHSVVFNAGSLELDGEDVLLRLADLRKKRFSNSEILSAYQSCDVLWDVASGRATGDYPPLDELKNEAVAVAWTKERSEWSPDCAEEGFKKPAYNIYQPVFLSAFKPKKQQGRNPWLTGISKMLKSPPESVSVADMLKKGINPWLAGLEIAPAQPAIPRRTRPKKTSQPKPVARFERDFSIAIIPKKGGKEIPLTIETELQTLIKKIINGGGNVPRTKLREDMLDNWRPEKLLESTIAKELVKAGLVGKKTTGRTAVYWAKKCAD